MTQHYHIEWITHSKENALYRNEHAHVNDAKTVSRYWLRRLAKCKQLRYIGPSGVVCLVPRTSGLTMSNLVFITFTCHAWWCSCMVLTCISASRAVRGLPLSHIWLLGLQWPWDMESVISEPPKYIVHNLFKLNSQWTRVLLQQMYHPTRHRLGHWFLGGRTLKPTLP